MLKAYMATKFDETHFWKKNQPRALKLKNAISDAGSLCTADQWKQHQPCGHPVLDISPNT